MTPDTLTPSVMNAAGFLARTGLSYRQLDHWIRCGVLRCHNGGRGSGRWRLFAADEVRVGRALGVAASVGASLVVLRRVAEEMRCCPAADWIRLSEPVAVVAAPRPDGGLYLSVGKPT